MGSKLRNPFNATPMDAGQFSPEVKRGIKKIKPLTRVCLLPNNEEATRVSAGMVNLITDPCRKSPTPLSPKVDKC